MLGTTSYTKKKKLRSASVPLPGATVAPMPTSEENNFSEWPRIPHEKLLGITWVSNPLTRKDLAARTWGVFWYKSKTELMIQIKLKGVIGVESPSPRSFWCGSHYCVRGRAIQRPRTKSAAARQLSNAHERDLVTNNLKVPRKLIDVTNISISTENW